MLRLLQQQPADVHRPAGFQDPATFARTIELERVRSDRTEIPIALIVFECATKERRTVVEQIERRVRQTDQVGVFNDDRLGVILWNCKEQGARQFIASVVEHLSRADYELFLYPTSPVGPDDSTPGSDKDARPEVDSQGRPAGQDASLVGASSSFATADSIEDRLGVVEHAVQSITQEWACDAPGRADASWDDRDDGVRMLASDESELPNLRIFDWPSADTHGRVSKYVVGQVEMSDHELYEEDESFETVAIAIADDDARPHATRRMPTLAESALTRIDELQELTAAELDEDAPRHEAQPLEAIFVRPLPKWKRCLDVLGAAFGLVVLSPLLLGTMALIKLTSRGPVLFKQQREGLGGKLFTIYKFRTMYLDADKRKDALRANSEQDGPCFKMEHDPRITPLGRFLRKSCIDELPQLWNVLIGDMTLVGPRPLDYRESHKIHQWGRRRLEVTPGLTCIWQVHGKSRVSFNEWMRMDIRYMRRRGFLFDLKLIRQTIQQVLLHRASH